MFSHCKSESLSINSTWRTQNKAKTSATQTHSISTRNACHQSTKVRNASTVSESPTAPHADNFNDDEISHFLRRVYPAVSKQLLRNLRFAPRLKTVNSSMLQLEISLSYLGWQLSCCHSFGSCVIGCFENDASSKICFWNINRSEIDAERPNREILAPSPVRSLCSNPHQPDILFVGFNNGDVRLLVEGDWSGPQVGHPQSVTATAWTNPQIIISASQDGSVTSWRFSKSKQKVEPRNFYRVKKNFGHITCLRVEMERFLLAAFDTNIFTVFEFDTSPGKSSSSDIAAPIELIPKRLFKNGFEQPFTAGSALSLRYLAPVDELVAFGESQIFTLTGTFAHEMRKMSEFGVALETDRHNRIVLPANDTLHVYHD